ncbi:acetolactate synthase AlsS [Eupransor demetentiae]|uniref:Acetolactate synthase large subunit or other thiamine pyrophosphate-requiring enzyme (IlvB) n=1 Tax=Eupransor demetentiae TaxID=3109584 RepID=A0ABM9N4B5_9LACO|nr:Acetolactate synthase large subunit or other thiamine pyrophosphate-requiring enzyme (IlvB) [Lactobacillaceae bacterium LMG 33000]
MAKKGSEIIVDTLNRHGVKFVFGIPGAKVDQLFETLEHPENGQKVPQLIVTRHEQNAAFMAQGIARLTGNAGVVITTSGPGVGNLATGLMTASAEGDAVVAIGGQVPRKDLYRLTHQSIPSKELMKPVTRYSVEIEDPNTISEILNNAFAQAYGPKAGAAFVSLPQDIDEAQVEIPALPQVDRAQMGPAIESDLVDLADQIKAAKLPVLLVGMRASDSKTVEALHSLLKVLPLPVVETFQGAGVVSRELEDQSFFGRIGLFHNQIGDQILQDSDLVITVGYDPIEYEPRFWNPKADLNIIDLDTTKAQFDNNFVPKKQLIGELAASLNRLEAHLSGSSLKEESQAILADYREKLKAADEPSFTPNDDCLSHPLSIVEETQKHVDDDMTVSLDIGSHYIWMARHFRSYKPRHLLISNGMQTLGVGLPWAMAAALVRPEHKSVAVVGDGGFFFSAAELETAVRLNLDITVIVWNDNSKYNMVEFQEELKYNNQSAGVQFGPIDVVKFADSCGAAGFRVESSDQLGEVFDQAFAHKGVSVIDVPVDYSHNTELASQIIGNDLN